MNEAEISRAMLPASPASHKGAVVAVYTHSEWQLYAALAPYTAAMCGPMYCRTPFTLYYTMSALTSDVVRRFIAEDVSVVLIVECLDSDNEHQRSSLYHQCSPLNERVVHVDKQGTQYLQTATMCVVVPGMTPSDVRECAIMAACAYEQYCRETELRRDRP